MNLSFIYPNGAKPFFDCLNKWQRKVIAEIEQRGLDYLPVGPGVFEPVAISKGSKFVWFLVIHQDFDGFMDTDHVERWRELGMPAHLETEDRAIRCARVTVTCHHAGLKDKDAYSKVYIALRDIYG